MNCKTITVSTGKTIDVYDDLFSFNERRDMYHFVRNSKFMVNGSDDPAYTYRPAGQQIYSLYSPEDIHMLGFFNPPKMQELAEKYGLFTRNARQRRINCSTCAEKNFPHTDGLGITLLYYVNPDWDMAWGGATMFVDDDAREVEHLSLFVPGRVLVFPGDILHTITPVSVMAPVNRYTLAIQYD